ncbi:MAG: phenylacetate--CoA ligase family protein [Rhodothermales bacterium]
MIERLRFLEKAQWWSKESIFNYRDSALRELITVAYEEVPFYHRLMDAASVKSSDIRTLDDLCKIPVVTKDMLRLGYPHLTTRDTGQKTHESYTSGSTGKNFCVRLDEQTVGRYRASFLLALGWAGWHLGEPHVQTGITLNRNAERKLKDWLLRCHYISATHLDDRSLDTTLDLIEKYSIKHLWGFPGSLYFLSLRAIENGWNRPLRSIVTWGDNLLPYYRIIIEKAFRTRVHDTYGCQEGMQIAAQCGHGDHYHIHSLDVIVEYLDDEGKPVAPGEPGSLILTRLHPGPMPLIRYQVGDIGVSNNGVPCVCGRGFELLQSIQGRDTDIVITPTGNRLIVHFFTGVLEHFTEVDTFQVIQEDLESIVLRIVPTRTFSEETAGAIVAALKQQGTGDLVINVECVQEIPFTPGGKRRFIISTLNG